MGCILGPNAPSPDPPRNADGGAYPPVPRSHAGQEGPDSGGNRPYRRSSPGTCRFAAARSRPGTLLPEIRLDTPGHRIVYEAGRLPAYFRRDGRAPADPGAHGADPVPPARLRHSPVLPGKRPVHVPAHPDRFRVDVSLRPGAPRQDAGFVPRDLGGASPRSGEDLRPAGAAEAGETLAAGRTGPPGAPTPGPGCAP